MKALALLAIVSLVGLTACDSESGSSQPGHIFPMKVGNYWALQMTSYDSSGIIREQYPDTIFVVDKKTVNGEDWFGFTGGGDDEDTTYGTNRADGYYQLDDAGNTTLLIKYPCSVYEQYIDRDTTFGGNIYSDITRVESTNAMISVPAGTFGTVKYSVHSEYFDATTNQTTVRPNYSVNYMAPGVGIVKGEGFRTSNGGREYLAFLIELTSYFVH